MGNKLLVVTGAASGMGLAVARRLAHPDHTLLLTDRDESGLASARDEITALGIGGGVDIVATDVADEESVRALAQRAEALGTLTTLVHAAGISPGMSDWRMVIQVNLVGTAIVLDAFLPLAGEGTCAVCFASAGAYIGRAAHGDPQIDSLLDDPRRADLFDQLDAANGQNFDAPGGSAEAYGWTKRGVIRMVRRECGPWGRRGARLVAVSPGIIDTPMSRFENSSRSDMDGMVAAIPAGRLGTAEEVADLVAFLASPTAAFITGTDVLVDGGFAAVLSPLP